MKPIIDEITKDQLISGRDQFKVGDGVRVHTRVREGEKETHPDFCRHCYSAQGTRYP